MRPGLVIFGAIFAGLGVAILVSLYAFPPGSTTEQSVTTIAPATIPATGWVNFGPIPRTGSSSATLTIDWQSSTPARVALYPSASCAAPPRSTCQGVPIVLWPSNTSGHWSGGSSLTYPVVLNVSSTTGVVATFQATAVDAYTVVTPLSTGFELLLDASAGALLAVGGVLVFLGLFLRGNVYGPPPPVVSRSADDVEEIARGGPPPGAP